jgi:hypothetical protein
MSINELLNEKEWRLCRGSETDNVEQQLAAFTYFCENYWYIKHPSKGRIKFVLRSAQVETVRIWMSERYTVVLKARQIGFSTLAAAYAFWMAYFFSDRFVIMLSRTEREAMKLLSKSKYGYKFLPFWMRSKGPAQTTDHQLKMVFENESAIESLPSGSDPARGESVYAVFVDEWAFLPNPEEAWASIEPIADIGGRVMGLSTANGSGNFFHQLWVGSQTGANKFVGIFYPWDADGERNDDWYNDKSRNMAQWQLHQEYPRSPDEAFIKSGNPVFDIDLLNSIVPIEADVGYFYEASDGSASFVPSDEGELSIWEFPQPDGVYVIGGDVAEGLQHGDYSSAHIINAKDGNVVAHWHGHIEPDLFGEALAELGWWYNGALLGVENNNHGLTTVKAAQRVGYRNLYRTRKLGNIRSEATEQLGWRTTTTSKPLMIDELVAAIRNEDIVLVCSKTIAELRTFVRKSNGRMNGSPYDDRTISLAIANQMLKYVWLPEYQNPNIVPRNSLAWWEGHIMGVQTVQKVPLCAHNVRTASRF